MITQVFSSSGLFLCSFHKLWRLCPYTPRLGKHGIALRHLLAGQGPFHAQKMGDDHRTGVMPGKNEESFQTWENLFANSGMDKKC